MAVSRAQIEALIAKLEPQLRKAFEDALKTWGDSIDYAAIAEALSRNDVEAAVRAANIQPAALNGFLTIREAAFEAGGAAEATGLRLNIVFNARHLRGEEVLKRQAAWLVQGLTDDTKAMMRTVLTDGLTRGQGAITTARQLKGYIGLTDNQAGYMLNLRRKLETDPKALLAEFEAGGYKLRDSRLDAIVRRAVKTETPIAAKDIETITNAYKNRSITWRSKNIARTETLSAVNSGRQEAFQQAIDSGKVQAKDVRRVWHAAKDKRTRDTHRGLDGQTVGMNEDFISLSGARLRFPGDPLAPLSETVACRCSFSMRVDYFSNLR